jgi:hypothetical protein
MIYVIFNHKQKDSLRNVNIENIFRHFKIIEN